MFKEVFFQVKIKCEEIRQTERVIKWLCMSCLATLNNSYLFDCCTWWTYWEVKQWWRRCWSSFQSRIYVVFLLIIVWLSPHLSPSLFFPFPAWRFITFFTCFPSADRDWSLLATAFNTVSSFQSTIGRISFWNISPKLLLLHFLFCGITSSLRSSQQCSGILCHSCRGLW